MASIGLNTMKRDMANLDFLYFLRLIAYLKSRKTISIAGSFVCNISILNGGNKSNKVHINRKIMIDHKP